MAENVFESNVVVLNKLGLHARPAALLAKKAMEFDCDIVAEKDGESFELRSLMSILMLAAPQGASFTIRTQGNNADTALTEIVALFESKFGED